MITKLVAALLLVVSTAYAQNTFQGVQLPGSYCFASAPSQPVPHSYYYTYNADSLAAQVICPTPLTFNTNGSTAINIDNASVSYYDASPLDDLYCSVMASSTTGSSYFSSTRYACATSGGCTTSGASFTGTGTISWTTSPVVNTSGNAVEAAALICHLPADYVHLSVDHYSTTQYVSIGYDYL